MPRLPRSATFVRGVLDDDQTAASPLILDDAARLLVGTALTVFPNNWVPEPGVRERDHGHAGQYAFARHHEIRGQSPTRRCTRNPEPRVCLPFSFVLFRACS